MSTPPPRAESSKPCFCHRQKRRADPILSPPAPECRASPCPSLAFPGTRTGSRPVCPLRPIGSCLGPRRASTSASGLQPPAGERTPPGALLPDLGLWHTCPPDSSKPLWGRSCGRGRGRARMPLHLGLDPCAALAGSGAVWRGAMALPRRTSWGAPGVALRSWGRDTRQVDHLEAIAPSGAL